MASYFDLGVDPGRNVLSRAFASSGDEFPEGFPLKKERRRRHRKLPKKRAIDIRQRMESGASDDSAEEVEANGEDDGVMGDSEESDDAEHKVFAPSGAVRRRSYLKKMKLKRRSLTEKTRLAGLATPILGSPKVQKPRSILAHSRTRSSEKVRFNLENLTSFADDLSDNDANTEQVEDVELSSDSNDEVYETLQFMSESDEDDERIEEMESEILIKHLEETGEISEILGDNLLAEITADQGPGLDDGKNFGINFFASIKQEDEQDDIVKSVEIVSEPFPIFHDAAEPASDLNRAEFETGLQTPSSIALAPKFDDEETEEEDPSKRRIAGCAAVNRMSSSHVSRRGKHRVRKNSKPNLPKRGSWSVPKGTTIITHDENDNIVMTTNGKVSTSGTITPKGVVHRNSLPGTPRIGIPMTPEFFSAITAPSSVQTSPMVGPSHESVFFSDATYHVTSPISYDVRLQDLINVPFDLITHKKDHL